MSCPSGFETALQDSCRVQCPTDYKYVDDPDGERCVSTYDNSVGIRLQKIPQNSTQQAFIEEQARFLSEFIKATRRLHEKMLENLSKAALSKQDGGVNGYENLKSQFDAADAYARAINELKPFRPATQPNVDIKNERLSILELTSKDIRRVQICLFFIIITLFEYLLLPPAIAHGAALFTLCVGLSLAIYLSNR
jgi:hypothetical protein